MAAASAAAGVRRSSRRADPPLHRTDAGRLGYRVRLDVTHTGVNPVRVTYHSNDLETDVRRTVAFEGGCSCGWTGPARKTYAHARDDAQRHSRETHGNESAAQQREEMRATGSAESS